MIRKEYMVPSTGKTEIQQQDIDSKVKDEIMQILHTSFLQGALVEIKILEGVDLANEGKRFSKIRMDIVSNTDFDTYKA